MSFVLICCSFCTIHFYGFIVGISESQCCVVDNKSWFGPPAMFRLFFPSSVAFSPIFTSQSFRHSGEPVAPVELRSIVISIADER
jgi:hypothetical protein